VGIRITGAQPHECRTVAEMIDGASHGLVDFLLRGIVPGASPVSIIAHALETGKDHYGLRNALVARDGDEPVGLSFSFPSEYHGITDETRAYVPGDRLDHLADLFAARVEESLYIDALFVDPRYRRRGIAGALIVRTAQRARGMGLKTISLIVMADNMPARRLYEQWGFAVVRPIRLEPHELLPREGGAFLMARAADAALLGMM